MFTLLRDSIILTDIVKKHSIKEISLIERIFHLMIGNIGSFVSPNKLVQHLTSSRVKTSFDTVTNFIKYICNALVFHKCERFDIRGRQVLSGNRKYYLNDLAFREYLSSGFDPGLSRRLENLFFLHFRSLGYRVYTGTINGKEVDFVIEKKGEREYWQIAYSLDSDEVVEREFRSLEMIKDQYRKSVVSLDDVSFGSRGGISHYRAWDVLSL